MKKQKIVLIVLVVASYICGYFTSTLFTNQKQKINIFGTYSYEQKTISVNHDLTYQYTYPFTSGQILKIDETTYKLKNENNNEFIVIFSTDNLKLIDTINNSIEEFKKVTSSESELGE